MALRKKPAIPDDVLEQVLADRVVRTMSDSDVLLGDMKKALAERLLNAERDHHRDGEAVAGRSDCRNGYWQKTVLTDAGQVRLVISRDRAATFDPQLIAGYRWRFPGVDDRIASTYARGMSACEIQSHLLEIYGREAHRT